MPFVMSKPEPVTRTVSPLTLMPVTFDTLNLGAILAGGVDFTGAFVADGLAEVGFFVGRAVGDVDVLGDADAADDDFDVFSAPLVAGAATGGADDGVTSAAAALGESGTG